MQVGDTVTPPANGAGPHAPADGGGASDGAAPDLAKMIGEAATAAVKAAMEPYTSKINGENAKFRKTLEALTKPSGTTSDSTPAAQDAPKSGENIEALVGVVEQIAEIRASLPGDVKDDLRELTEGLTYAEKLRLYQAAQRTHERTAKAATTEAGGATPAASTGGATPKQKSTAAAATSASRDGPSHPQYQSEYADLTRTPEGRKRKAALDADPTFDPSTLPRRPPRY